MDDDSILGRIASKCVPENFKSHKVELQVQQKVEQQEQPFSQALTSAALVNRLPSALVSTAKASAAVPGLVSVSGVSLEVPAADSAHVRLLRHAGLVCTVPRACPGLLLHTSRR